MATTTNYGWTTPNDTDLVKDGAAAIRTLGSSVDTSMADLLGGTTGQVLSKASDADMDFTWSADAAGMVNPMTTTGDTIYSSSGSTPARLGIGTSGQVLSVSGGGVPTWTTPSGGYTLISTTTLSGSSTSITSIPATYTNLMLIIQDYYPSTAASFGFRINNDTSTFRNYAYWGINNNTGIPVDDSAYGTGTVYLNDANTAASDNNNSAWIEFPNYTATDSKFIDAWNFYKDAGGTYYNFHATTRFEPTSAISSIQLLTSAGTFTQGTARLYGI